jgi:crossover junction endodeoxyribonuclease RuvC
MHGHAGMLYAFTMRILGIDPGLTTAGLGLIEVTKGRNPTVIEWLTITTEKSLPLPERLAELAKDLRLYLKEAAPDHAVVEKLFFATNRLTAMDTAEARGVILLTLNENGIPIQEVTPLQLKVAITGDGSADKRQVQEMVQRTLKLKELPSPADAADALALALFGAFTADRLSPVSFEKRR